MKNLILYLKTLLDRYIHFVPIIMFLVTLATNFMELKAYNLEYVILGNSIGYSIFSNITTWYLFNRKSGEYCWLIRNIPLGLMFINVVDICGLYLPYKKYCIIFNIAICMVILILAIIFVIKKKLKNDKFTSSHSHRIT